MGYLEIRTRIEHYEKLIKLLRDKEGPASRVLNIGDVGLCCHIESMFGVDVYNHEIFMSNYPELFAQKPKGAGENDYWFPASDSESRVEVLKKAIELAKKELQHKK